MFPQIAQQHSYDILPLLLFFGDIKTMTTALPLSNVHVNMYLLTRDVQTWGHSIRPSSTMTELHDYGINFPKLFSPIISASSQHVKVSEPKFLRVTCPKQFILLNHSSFSLSSVFIYSLLYRFISFYFFLAITSFIYLLISIFYSIYFLLVFHDGTNSAPVAVVKELSENLKHVFFA